MVGLIFNMEANNLDSSIGLHMPNFIYSLLRTFFFISEWTNFHSDLKLK